MYCLRACALPAMREFHFHNQVMEKWHFYVREALCQIDFAKRSYAKFRSSLEADEVFSVFYHLHHFIVHVSNVDKLLDPKKDSERANILSGHIDLIGVNLKPIRTLRNHLEHFDNRLDDWVAKHYGDAFFDMNIATGAKGFPWETSLRGLDGEIYKFYGEEFPLPSVLEAVEKLELILRQLISR